MRRGGLIAMSFAQAKMPRSGQGWPLKACNPRRASPGSPSGAVSEGSIGRVEQTSPGAKPHHRKPNCELQTAYNGVPSHTSVAEPHKLPIALSSSL